MKASFFARLRFLSLRSLSMASVMRSNHCEIPALLASESRYNRQKSRHCAEQFLLLAQCALFRCRSFHQSIEEYKERRLQPLSTSSCCGQEPHPEERRLRRVSKDEAIAGASWFETAQGRLLT